MWISELSDLRGLALSIQFGRTETFFDNESSNFLRFILLHRLQQPLITLTPVLTLGEGVKNTHHHREKGTDRREQVNTGESKEFKSESAELQHLYSNTSIIF